MAFGSPELDVLPQEEFEVFWEDRFTILSCTFNMQPHMHTQQPPFWLIFFIVHSDPEILWSWQGNKQINKCLKSNIFRK